MVTCLQFVYVSKNTFSHISLLKFSFPLESLILHSTNMGADDMQMKRNESCMKLRLDSQTRRPVDR